MPAIWAFITAIPPLGRFFDSLATVVGDNGSLQRVKNTKQW